MRERDARAAIAANATRIRLLMKTVIAGPVQSPGISERIRTPTKTEMAVMPDTYLVAAAAVTVEPVSLG
jgi:hypothetical protein